MHRFRRYLIRTVLVILGLALVLAFMFPFFSRSIGLPLVSAVDASIAEIESIYRGIEQYREQHGGRNPETLVEILDPKSKDTEMISRQHYKGYYYRPHSGPKEPLVGCCAMVAPKVTVVVWVTGDGTIYAARARLWPTWKKTTTGMPMQF